MKPKEALEIPRAPTREGGPKVSLTRALSKLGICSRAEARGWIEEGRVSVNGRTIRNPEVRVDPEAERIRFDGRTIRPAPFQYLMMHKPKGVLTTHSDERGRKTVYDLLGERRAWLFPVGRLDKETSGLLLLTNDTQWGHKIAAPESKVSKLYHVKLNRHINEDDLARLTRGVTLEGGVQTRPAAAKLLRRTRTGCWIQLALSEGLNRQVRRMCEALGYRVKNLVRVSIGNLPLGDLAPGEIRPLTPRETAALAPTSQRSLRSAGRR